MNFKHPLCKIWSLIITLLFLILIFPLLYLTGIAPNLYYYSKSKMIYYSYYLFLLLFVILGTITNSILNPPFVILKLTLPLSFLLLFPYGTLYLMTLKLLPPSLPLNKYYCIIVSKLAIIIAIESCLLY